MSIVEGCPFLTEVPCSDIQQVAMQRPFKRMESGIMHVSNG